MVPSSPELLALHALGGSWRADRHRGGVAVPARSGLGRRALAGREASGWTRQYEWFGNINWSLTERGELQNERQLASELDAADVRHLVAAVHRAFLPLKAPLAGAGGDDDAGEGSGTCPSPHED